MTYLLPDFSWYELCSLLGILVPEFSVGGSLSPVIYFEIFLFTLQYTTTPLQYLPWVNFSTDYCGKKCYESLMSFLDSFWLKLILNSLWIVLYNHFVICQSLLQPPGKKLGLVGGAEVACRTFFSLIQHLLAGSWLRTGSRRSVECLRRVLLWTRTFPRVKIMLCLIQISRFICWERHLIPGKVDLFMFSLDYFTFDFYYNTALFGILIWYMRELTDDPIARGGPSRSHMEGARKVSRSTICFRQLAMD